MSCVEQENAVLHKFGAGQAFAIDAAGDQAGQHIVFARVLPPRIDQCVQIARECRDSVIAALQDIRRRGGFQRAENCQ